MIEYHAEQYLLSKPIILDNATNFCTILSIFSRVLDNR